MVRRNLKYLAILYISVKTDLIKLLSHCSCYFDNLFSYIFFIFTFLHIITYEIILKYFHLIPTTFLYCNTYIPIESSHASTISIQFHFKSKSQNLIKLHVLKLPPNYYNPRKRYNDKTILQKAQTISTT